MKVNHNNASFFLGQKSQELSEHFLTGDDTYFIHHFSQLQQSSLDFHQYLSLSKPLALAPQKQVKCVHATLLPHNLAMVKLKIKHNDISIAPKPSVFNSGTTATAKIVSPEKEDNIINMHASNDHLLDTGNTRRKRKSPSIMSKYHTAHKSTAGTSHFFIGDNKLILAFRLYCCPTSEIKKIATLIRQWWCHKIPIIELIINGEKQ